MGILLNSAATPLANPPHPEHPPHPPQNSRAFEWKLLNLKHIHQQLPSTFVWRPVAGGSWKKAGFWEVFSHLWCRGGRAPLGGPPAFPLGLKTQGKAIPTGRRCSHGFANLPLQASTVTGSPSQWLEKNTDVKYVKYLIVKEQKASVSCAGQVH